MDPDDLSTGLQPFIFVYREANDMTAAKARLTSEPRPPLRMHRLCLIPRLDYTSLTAATIHE